MLFRQLLLPQECMPRAASLLACELFCAFYFYRKHRCVGDRLLAAEAKLVNEKNDLRSFIRRGLVQTARTHRRMAELQPTLPAVF